MALHTVALDSASSEEHRQALQEVRDFFSTDMGRGGPERWTYRILSEPLLTAELARVSDAQSRRHLDAVSFQPCASVASEDRYSFEEWELEDGTWIFSAVYDGHLSHDAVGHVARHLPGMVKQSLHAAISNSRDVPPEDITRLLSDSIVQLDSSLTSSLLDLFPGGVEGLMNLRDDEIRSIIDSPTGNLALKGLQGTTVLCTLTDPSRKNLWVANLGDSQAILATRNNSDSWSGKILNSLHNCDNPLEIERVKREHMGETSCIVKNRVLGFLAPTRAIGDVWAKLPAEYTLRIFGSLDQRWQDQPKAALASRILSPPYISNVPEMTHYVLQDAPSNPTDRPETFLILCTDGLLELYEDFDSQERVSRWVNIVGQALESPVGIGGRRANAALDLLRDAIGGEDIETVSRNLTVEMEDRWLDDTTILVQHF